MSVRTVAIIQSSYIPWKGYFDIINDVDEFIFLDDVQYTVRDWRTRNRIKTANGLMWLTVPAGSNRNRLICDVTIEDSSWQKRHWQTIRHNYSRAPYFREYESFFEELYLGRTWTNLSDMNRHITQRIATDLLGIRTTFTDSRTYNAQGARLGRILDLIRLSGAKRYLSGPSASNYLDIEKFKAIGVELKLKDYSDYPEYPQLYQPFEHTVSVIDLIFNTGPHAISYIWGHRSMSRKT
ncbi:MAG TPA: WbqC family protein [Candidatus Saccharimonadales bacterium]|nr:WbqC family protein [Candidatus Saccharimonadales bacterium]